MGSTRPPVGATPLVLLAIAVLVVGCGGDDGGADRTSTSAEAATGSDAVTVRDYTYEPARITVPKGATVTFVNRDSTPHTATSKESGLFESGSLETGKSGQVVLGESGAFAYYCLFHPFMKGTVVVE
ncbi:MAG TPA: cupredoxin family copper-binding protein [Solirubrobacterales bacterium]|nr:cupredoxin family copper-binding protein [Solirubrobacterales bacterium]